MNKEKIELTDSPDYLKGFSPAQQKIILGAEPIKQVVAAAGSGKTRTVIGLVEHYLYEKLETTSKILILSFSRKAVGELRQRLDEKWHSQVEITTFHAFCYYYLRQAYPRALTGLKILSDEEKEEFFLELFKYPSPPLAKEFEAMGGIPLTLAWEEGIAFRQNYPSLYDKLQLALQQYKRKHRLFTFEDLIHTMLYALRSNKKAVADLRKRYSLIVVDEFQDTDLQQLEFLNLMDAANKVVVGDDWQAIYSFRGATLQPFLEFQRVSAAKLYYLYDNYRSLENIVRLGNRVINASSQQIPKRVRAIRGLGNGFPVLALNLERILPQELGACLQQQTGSDYYLLVRTNWRRKFWIEAVGLPEERVMTIHKSKGLEFPVVFLDLCGGWSNCAPKKRKKSAIQSLSAVFYAPSAKNNGIADEEVRILYVGVSRAMNLLAILHLPAHACSETERFYFEKLISPQVRDCSLEELEKWLRKETQDN